MNSINWFSEKHSTVKFVPSNGTHPTLIRSILLFKSHLTWRSNDSESSALYIVRGWWKENTISRWTCHGDMFLVGTTMSWKFQFFAVQKSRLSFVSILSLCLHILLPFQDTSSIRNRPSNKFVEKIERSSFSKLYLLLQFCESSSCLYVINWSRSFVCV